MSLRKVDRARSRALTTAGDISRRFRAEYVTLGRQMRARIRVGEPDVAVLENFAQGLYGIAKGFGSTTTEGRLALVRLRQRAEANLRMNLLASQGLPSSLRATLAGESMSPTLTEGFTLARTGIMNTLRNEQQATIIAGPENAWVWRATLGPRTCAWCLSMHGTVHDQRQSLNEMTHLNCRCTMVPHRKGDKVPFETGDEWLARQPISVQDEILHPLLGEAYRRGVYTLRRIARQGGGRKSLSELLGKKRVEMWKRLRYQERGKYVPRVNRKGFIDSRVGAREFIRDNIDTVVDYAAKLLDTESVWSGRLTFQNRMGEAGSKWPDCHINISTWLLAENPGRYLGTMFHESFHAASNGLFEGYKTALAYRAYPAFEEGLAEGLTRLFYRDLVEEKFPAFLNDESFWRAWDRRVFNHSYNPYVNDINHLIDELNVEPDSFYVEAAKIPFAERPDWVLGIADAIADEEGWKSLERRQYFNRIQRILDRLGATATRIETLSTPTP